MKKKKKVYCNSCGAQIKGRGAWQHDDDCPIQVEALSQAYAESVMDSVDHGTATGESLSEQLDAAIEQFGPNVTVSKGPAGYDSAEFHWEHAARAAEEAVVPPRAVLLREAESLITGDRNKSYGSPTENFANIAALFNTQFGHMLKSGHTFTAAQVAQAMIHVKMARLIAQPKRDNYLDIVGYAGCGWEAEEQS